MPKEVSYFSPPTAHIAKEAESHTFSAMRSGDNFYLATTSGTGADLWDITTPAKVKFLSHVAVPNTNYGDYTEAVWGLSWVGQYLYIGATNNGVAVVDTTDVTAPKIVTKIASSAIGGVNAGPVDVVGNILIAMTPKNNSGIATVDVSDPLKPVKLASITTATNSYITQFYRHYAFRNRPDASLGPADESQEHLGHADVLAQQRVRRVPRLSRRPFVPRPRPHQPRNRPRRNQIRHQQHQELEDGQSHLGRMDDNGINDDQFLLPFGKSSTLATTKNPITVGCSEFIKQSPTPSPPIVDTVIPKDQTTGVSVTTAIGVSLTDNIELASLNQATFIVREVGTTTAHPGRYGVRMGVINFDPEGDSKPGTTYESSCRGVG